jgi:hypothetical protein
MSFTITSATQFLAVLNDFRAAYGKLKVAHDAMPRYRTRGAYKTWLKTVDELDDDVYDLFAAMEDYVEDTGNSTLSKLLHIVSSEECPALDIPAL